MKNVEKEKSWQKKLKELNGVGDRLGLSLDNKIKETVAVLQLLEINTSGSCEGHIDRALGAPWVDIDAPNEPKENFIKENEVYQKYANKYKIPFEDVKHAVNIDAWREAYNEAEKNGERPELTKWRQENHKLKENLEKLLNEFYRNRSVSQENKIEIEVYGVGDTNRLHNGGKDYQMLVSEMSPLQRKGLAKRLTEHQAEMTAFTEFLKDKYFNQN